MKSNKRTLFLLIILILVGALSYPSIKSNFGIGESANEIVEPTIVTGKVDELLSQIQATKLDVSLLESPTFTYLNDFSLPFIDIPIGRLNPFASLR